MNFCVFASRIILLSLKIKKKNKNEKFFSLTLDLLFLFFFFFFCFYFSLQKQNFNTSLCTKRTLWSNSERLFSEKITLSTDLCGINSFGSFMFVLLQNCGESQSKQSMDQFESIKELRDEYIVINLKLLSRMFNDVILRNIFGRIVYVMVVLWFASLCLSFNNWQLIGQ